MLIFKSWAFRHHSMKLLESQFWLPGSITSILIIHYFGCNSMYYVLFLLQLQKYKWVKWVCFIMTHWVQELFMFGLELHQWNSKRACTLEHIVFDNWRYAIILTNVMMGFGFTISAQICKNVSNYLYPTTYLLTFQFSKKLFHQIQEKKLSGI